MEKLSFLVSMMNDVLFFGLIVWCLVVKGLVVVANGLVVVSLVLSTGLLQVWLLKNCLSCVLKVQRIV